MPFDLLKTTMNKKAQIQIGETIAVLFVFFILIAVGIVFYVKVIKSNLESEKQDLSQLGSVAIAQRVMFMPEIQCSQDVVEEITNCIDILKLESAPSTIRENELYYYDLLEFGDVSISQIYPNDARWALYSRKTKDFNNRFVTNVPISLFDPITRKNGFGVLTIETLSK